MKDGVIKQIGTPSEIYAKPENPFVAGFIGVSNFLDCNIEKGGNVSIKDEIEIKVPLKKEFVGKAKLSARPEQLMFADKGMPGTVQLLTFLGDYIEYEVQLDDGQSLIVNEYTKDSNKVYKEGEKVHITFDPLRINIYDADTEEVISKWKKELEHKNGDLTSGSL